MVKKIILFLSIDYQVIMRIYSLVFILVEKDTLSAEFENFARLRGLHGHARLHCLHG